MIADKVIKHIVLASFGVSAFLWASCDADEPKPHVPADEIFSSKTILVPDKDTKEVTTSLTFNNLEAIDYLMVRKSGGDGYSRKIERSELSSSYNFSYTIQQVDPENFKLVFKAYYKDSNASKDFFLEVDNRWGFFIRNITRIARVTGTPMLGEALPSPNNTPLTWNVGGTDLGIVWEMQPGNYGIFFGDTFGRNFKPNAANPGPNGGSWRSNVLAFSTDGNLEDGLLFSSMATDVRGDAREIVYGGKDTSGNGNFTSIPTAAIRANGIDYVHYFNIKTWTGWVTNYSGMYKSVDDGQTWTKCENVSFSSNSNFGQAGYFKKDGYVYMIGTETGRESNARLARFLESDIENQADYEFWNGSTNQWVKSDESKATNIIDGRIGELSFIYNDKHQKWIIAYFNSSSYNITMRLAEDITGPWSEPYVLATGSEYPQLYGSYFHPLSAHGDNLYFLMSMWLPYNVFLMKVELADMGNFTD